MSAEDLKAVKEAKGSGKWEADVKRERAEVAWGEASNVVDLLDALGLNPGERAKGGSVQEEGPSAAGEVEET
jgi:hypothetical protein